MPVFEITGAGTYRTYGGVDVKIRKRTTSSEEAAKYPYEICCDHTPKWVYTKEGRIFPLEGSHHKDDLVDKILCEDGSIAMKPREDADEARPEPAPIPSPEPIPAETKKDKQPVKPTAIPKGICSDSVICCVLKMLNGHDDAPDKHAGMYKLTLEELLGPALLDSKKKAQKDLLDQQAAELKAMSARAYHERIGGEVKKSECACKYVEPSGCFLYPEVLLKTAEMFIGQCSEGEVVNEWLYKVIAQRRLELSTKVLIYTQEYQTFITPD